MPDVLLSYDHDDALRVAKVVDGLKTENIKFWWDQNLEPGQVWAQVIDDKLDDANRVLVHWSKNARSSLYVRGEALDALDRGKLLQVSLDGARLPVPFNAIQTVFLDDWGGDRGDNRWRGLVNAILGAPIDLGLKAVEEAKPTGAEPIALPRKQLMRAGLTPFQRMYHWFLSFLTMLFVGAAAVLGLVKPDLPQGWPPNDQIFLGVGVGIVVLFAILVANTFLLFLKSVAKRN